MVRGGYGIFYDTLNLRLISLADRQNGQQVLRIRNRRDRSRRAAISERFSPARERYVSAKPSVTGFSPNFKTQYAHQANLQVEQELIRDLSVTMGLQWYGGHRAAGFDRYQSGPGQGTSRGRPAWFSSANRPNPVYNQIFALSSRWEFGLLRRVLRVNKRFSRRFQFTASYTLGYAFNDNDSVGDNGSNVVNPTNLHAGLGWSSSDQRHRFVLQGVWQPAVQ